MLDWLTEAERRLRYQGTMPDNEEVLEQQLAEHQVTSSVCHAFDSQAGCVRLVVCRC